MKRTMFISALCLLFGSMVFAQDWVTFTKSNPESPVISLIYSNNQQVEYTVEVCGMYKNDLNEEGEDFQRIEIPGSGKMMETGEPELPCIRQLIAIPECDDVVLTVNITGQTDFNNYNIYPAPDYEEVQDPNGGVYLQEVFTKNEAVYAQNTYLPGMNAEIVSTGYLRGQKYAEVYLYPVQFNPVTNHINVNTYYQVSLDFINPTTDVNVNTGIFNNVATNVFLNYVSSGITASINDNMQGNGNVQWITLTNPDQADTITADYLIICAQPFFQPNEPTSEVLRIANHRATYNGFDVAILDASNIISDDLGFYYEDYPEPEFKDEQRIRTCIRRIYEGTNAQHTYDGMLGYVLLVGDELPGSPPPSMPTSYNHPYSPPFMPEDKYPADYYYSCVTKQQNIYDETGDLFIGRFCVDNNLINGLTELQNVVNKTIFYESEATFRGWRDEIGVLIDDICPVYMPVYFNFIDNLVPAYFTVDKIDASQPNTHENIYQVMNDGIVTFTYYGHGTQNGWSAGGYLDMSDLVTNLTNTYKAPVVHAVACETGHFDKDGDCFGESLVTYSGTDGFTGYLGAGRIVSGHTCSIISDPPGLFQELLQYTIFNDLSHITGEYILESKLMNLMPDNGQYKYAFNFFGDPALNIMAQGFEVTQYTELPAITTISTEITVKNGATLIIPTNGQLFFENDGCLTIEEGATLAIWSYATISGNSPNQNITIEGNLLASSASFTAMEGTDWEGIKLNNAANHFFFNNSSFDNCMLSGESKKLSVYNCSFSNSGIKYGKGDLLIENSNFDNSQIRAIYGNSKSSFVEIKPGCTIQNCENEPAIYIEGYYNYSIDGCTINGNYGDGIGIFNSGGSGSTSTKEIKNNMIINNGWESLGSGIEIYHSYVDIYGDQLIEGNKYGILCLNNSNVSILGNELANHIYETQIIRNNNKYQVYASQNSFPYFFRWNAIIDEDNEYPLVYYSTPPGYPEELDVSCNYWGNNFTPSEDLYPFDYYIYEPIWNLNGGDCSGDAEAKYNSAQSKITQEDYAGAKIKFQQIISDYPNSKFAQAALRELFILEEYATDDYTSLKTYYNTEAVIQNHPDLAKLAEFLINFCEIKLENYPTAISWFENVIQNPESLEDSIFAIIDLGYTYFLMENGGLKSAYEGILAEYIPASKKQFEEKRDYLLTLLFKDSQINESLENELKPLKEGELLQNVPNPFSGTTEIWYNLKNESNIQLNIYNYTGQLIRSIDEGNKTKGTHFFKFDASGLKSGIYFYSININGKTTDSKKMTIMK